uniref:Preprotein-translocase subunit g n=1 Tax=Digenea simplex TaxID=945030 RepID=A0A1Z1MUZ1_DIGSM|nr:preprotein-translocase subunit g [Digenea simplex]ARW69555.1 preprotein-translocase subunit g [Digenea simplex]
MFKLLWYFFSLLTIVFVLVISPSRSSAGNSINQSKIFAFSSNQASMQKLLVFSIFMFFTLTVLLLVKSL